MSGSMSSRSQIQLTALMLASEAGQEDVVRGLIERGDDVNVETEQGQTALRKAVFGHHPAIIHLLAQHRAIVSESRRGSTALHLAALLNDAECAEALLDCGADIDAQDAEYGLTPLLEAMSESDGDFRGSAVAHLLVKRGADVAIKDTKDRTVLDYAQDYYDCWIEYADSVWLGRKQLDLIDLVRRTAAHQALR